MSLLDYDLAILQFVNQPYLPYINFFAIFINYSIYIFLLYLAYILMVRHEKSKFTHLILVTIIGYVIIASLKFFIARPRPYLVHDEILGLFDKSDMSFPSAHTFISVIGYYFISKITSGFTKYIFAIYLLFLIPVGLMYIGIHYPTDIVTGAIIGIVLPRLLSEKTSVIIFKNIINLTLRRNLFKT